MKPSSQEQHTS